MLGAILRLILVLLALAGLFIFFAYAFIAALIVTPFLLLFLYLVGRRVDIQWWTVRQTQERPRPPHGPVIDHDPNDLPRSRDAD